MPNPRLTGIVRIPKMLLEWASENGMDVDELRREAGLKSAELRDPDSRVPVQKTWNLARAIGRRNRQPGLGIRMGREVAIRELGLVGYAMFHSRTLRDAYERLVRYGRIVSEVLRCELLPVGDSAERLVLHTMESQSEPERITELRLAAVLGAARELTGRNIDPIGVDFAFSRPSDTSEHERFFRAPLRFDQRKSALTLRGEDLDLPVQHSDETLAVYLDRLAEREVEPFIEPQSFKKKVEWALWQELSRGDPALERTASVLGVSVRTLQRRLRSEGSSFAAELEEVRRRMSTRLLEDDNLAVYEVAFLLGYSEPSTFFRAFRRWYGTTPRIYRGTRTASSGLADTH